MNVNTPLDVIESVRNWITDTDIDHEAISISCFNGPIYYIVTLLGCCTSYTLFIYSYKYIDKEDQYYLQSSNRYSYEVPLPDTVPMVTDKIIHRLVEDLHVVPVLDDELCFYLNGRKYQLDYCQGRTEILLIFQVNEAGTPISCDFMCNDDILESGKPIPDAVYEYLTNERKPE